jgi:hypothetical protein
MTGASDPQAISGRDTEFGKDRRTTILRLLAKQTGDDRAVNFEIVMDFLRRTRFEAATRDMVHKDLDSLKQYGAITEQWIDGGLRVVKITDRGDDGARGRLKDMPVIISSYWEP